MSRVGDGEDHRVVLVHTDDGVRESSSTVGDTCACKTSAVLRLEVTKQSRGRDPPLNKRGRSVLALEAC